MGAIGSGPSFPTYPLAKTFNAVVVCDCCLEAIGANAEALAVSVTTSRQIDFIMVVRNAEPVMCRWGRYSCCSVSPAAIVSLLGLVRTRDCQSRICFNFIVANVEVIFISGYLPTKPIFSVFNECMLRFLHPPRTVEQPTNFQLPTTTKPHHDEIYCRHHFDACIVIASLCAAATSVIPMPIVHHGVTGVRV